MIGMPEGIRMSGVRHPEGHSLRVYRTARPGEKIQRTFWCSCGKGFGRQYDTNARVLYRWHLRDVKK